MSTTFYGRSNYRSKSRVEHDNGSWERDRWWTDDGWMVDGWWTDDGWMVDGWWTDTGIHDHRLRDKYIDIFNNI